MHNPCIIYFFTPPPLNCRIIYPLLILSVSMCLPISLSIYLSSAPSFFLFSSLVTSVKFSQLCQMLTRITASAGHSGCFRYHFLHHIVVVRVLRHIFLEAAGHHSLQSDILKSFSPKHFSSGFFSLMSCLLGHRLNPQELWVPERRKTNLINYDSSQYHFSIYMSFLYT